MLLRDLHKKRHTRLHDPSDWLNYKQLRNEVTLELKAKRKSYFSQELEESQCNIKETWKVLNTVMGRKSKTTVINSLDVNSDTIITEYHEQLSLLFNDYLYKKQSGLSLNIQHNPLFLIHPINGF